MSDWQNRIVGYEQVEAHQLQAHPYNARRHPARQREALRGSLDTLGWIAPVVINKTTGYCIDGHARIEEALTKDESALLPVIYVELEPHEEAQALASYDFITYMAEYDRDNLDALLRDVQTDDERVSSLLSELAEGNGLYFGDEPVTPDAPDAQIDQAEELNEKWQVQTGDLWVIPSLTGTGEHRLLCGDSIQTQIELPNIFDVIFDPPWDIEVVQVSGANTIVFTDGMRFADVIKMYGAPTWVFTWDCITSWYTPNRPLRRGKYALWYGDIANYDFDGAHYGDAGESRNVQNTRGEYNFTPDPRGKHLSDVYSEPITQLHAQSEHSHSKPIDWMRMLIGNCTQNTVCDPFGGSGTTMVACEQLARQCRMIEIEPKYCAVILERMTAMGCEPHKVD